jgi:ABC-type transport system involved in multi-copper enzyme maturation permease subunit
VIWLTWRQHRQQALAGAIGLGLIALFLFLTHSGIAREFRTSGLQSCLASGNSNCGGPQEVFSGHYNGLQFLIPLFLVVPLLVGLFWGAPMVAREMEQGTYRLAWTQSVTRRRWFTTKVALVGGAAVAGAVAFAELVTWWSSMFVRASDDRFVPGIFDIRGIVPIAYVLFALALGVLVGTLVRRTLPAMAATLGAFIGVRALVTLFLRAHYIAAKALSAPLPIVSGKGGLAGIAVGPDRNLVGAWVLKQVTVDRAGSLVSNGLGFDFNYMSAHCPGTIPPAPTSPSPSQLAACVHRLGIHSVTTYQPGSKFWAFQGIESAIYVALAAALFLVAGWVVRRRLA